MESQGKGGSVNGLLTTTEAAERLGVERRSLEAWRVRGGGPLFIRISARCVRYRISDLEAFIEARARRSTSDPGPADVQV